MIQLTATEPRFAICIANTDSLAALAVRNISQVLPDADAAQHPYLRISDESGEDYLYPAAYFVPIDLPQGGQEALFKVA